MSVLHSTDQHIFDCKIPWTEEPGGFQSMESQRVGHDCACMHTRSTLVCDGIRQEWGKNNPKALEEQSMRFIVSRVEFVVLTTRVGKENVIDRILGRVLRRTLPK